MAKDFDQVPRWELVKQLFHAALAEPPDQRAAYLRRACGGNQLLQQEVERLLDNDCLAGDFLEEPAAEIAAQALMWERSHAAAGKQIGPWQLAADEPADVRTRRGLAISFSSIGDLQLGGNGDAAAALENHRQALAIRKELAAADPTNVQSRRDLAVSHLKMGSVLEKKGSPAQAMAAYRKALTIFAALSAASPANVQARRDLVRCHRQVGGLQGKSGDPVGALASYRRAMSLAESLSAAAPDNAQARVEILLCHERIGEALSKLGRLREAMESYREELRLAEAMAASDPGNAESRFDLALACSKLGQTQAALALSAKTPRGKRIENWRGARSWFRRSQDIFLDLRKQGPIRAIYAGEMDKVGEEISRCDAALAAFQNKRRR